MRTKDTPALGDDQHRARWTLSTFAAGQMRWLFAARRLQRQSLRTGVFPDVQIYDATWLRNYHPQVWESANAAAGTRGYGYWRWKPHLVLESLERAKSQGQGVVYLDAGCELNINDASRNRLKEYFSMAWGDHPVAMQLDAPISAWCKSEVLKYFSISEPEACSIPVVEAGVLILAPTPNTMNLVRSWVESSDIQEGFLFDDRLNLGNQSPMFQDHRHDQAVLSCLLHRHGMKGIPAETFFAPDWSTQGREFPIWAMRNRFPFSRKPGTPFGETLKLVSRMKPRQPS